MMRTPKPVTRAAAQGGFTLVELIIAISLVAAISTGMLLAMRNGLMTLDRVSARLDDNRRALALDRLLHGQLGGVIPVIGDCGGAGRFLFTGDASRMRMVSTYSRTGGARGYPVIVQYEIQRNPDGTFRLVSYEVPFAGPDAAEPLCTGGANGRRAEIAESSGFVLADRLASARFFYQERHPLTRMGEEWLTFWDRYELPAALRVEMIAADPLVAKIPQGSVTVPLHITWRTGENNYADVP